MVPWGHKGRRDFKGCKASLVHWVSPAPLVLRAHRETAGQWAHRAAWVRWVLSVRPEASARSDRRARRVTLVQRDLPDRAATLARRGYPVRQDLRALRDLRALKVQRVIWGRREQSDRPDLRVWTASPAWSDPQDRAVRKDPPVLRDLRVPKVLGVLRDRREYLVQRDRQDLPAATRSSRRPLG